MLGSGPGANVCTLEGLDPLGNSYDKYTPIKFDDQPLVSIYVENWKVMVDTSFLQGNQQVVFRNNRLLGRPTNWDYNANGIAMEAVDESGRPVLQVQYIDRMTVVVRGVFYSRSGNPILVDDYGITTGDDFQKRRAALKPIFRHPSTKYPGQMTSNGFPSVQHFVDEEHFGAGVRFKTH